MKTERKSPKRLLIDINEPTHMKIKKICAEKRISIKQWVLDAVEKQIKIEEDLGF